MPKWQPFSYIFIFFGILEAAFSISFPPIPLHCAFPRPLLLCVKQHCNLVVLCQIIVDKFVCIDNRFVVSLSKLLTLTRRKVTKIGTLFVHDDKGSFELIASLVLKLGSLSQFLIIFLNLGLA